MEASSLFPHADTRLLLDAYPSWGAYAGARSQLVCLECLLPGLPRDAHSPARTSEMGRFPCFPVLPESVGSTILGLMTTASKNSCTSLMRQKREMLSLFEDAM